MLIRQNLRLLLISIFISLFSIFHPALSAQSAETIPSAQPTPADIWNALQERTPFPYSLQLPPLTFTVIDGIYVKQESLIKEHVHCRRCPDWLYEGGLWKIRFDRGIYRVFHADIGWKSLGSYTVSGDQLTLFNDPYCIEDIGLYMWKLEKGVLTFQVINDMCAIRLRGKNLTHLPWLSCQPPNNEAAVTDHWEKPKGCE